MEKERQFFSNKSAIIRTVLLLILLSIPVIAIENTDETSVTTSAITNSEKKEDDTIGEKLKQDAKKLNSDFEEEKKDYIKRLIEVNEKEKVLNNIIGIFYKNDYAASDIQIKAQREIIEELRDKIEGELWNCNQEVLEITEKQKQLSDMFWKTNRMNGFVGNYDEADRNAVLTEIPTMETLEIYMEIRQSVIWDEKQKHYAFSVWTKDFESTVRFLNYMGKSVTTKEDLFEYYEQMDND